MPVEGQGTLALPRVTGVLLVSCFAVFAIGGLLFTARNGMAGKPAPNFAYLALERGFIMAAVVVTALGLALLAALVGREHNDAVIPARLAAATYAVAAILILSAEASLLRNGSCPRTLIVAYVAVAFLAQAAFGAIVVRTGFLPAWIGWAAIVWNVAWLLILPVLSPRDIYYPVLHHVIPLVIGIALLRRG
jgi:hypothetical protein